MATVPNIDVNTPMVQILNELEGEIYKNGAASPYFEELWNVLVQCIAELDARVTALETP